MNDRISMAIASAYWSKVLRWFAAQCLLATFWTLLFGAMLRDSMLIWMAGAFLVLAIILAAISLRVIVTLSDGRP
jgi:hypothetical protein